MPRQADVITNSLTITAETQADRVLNLLAMTGLDGQTPLKFQDIADSLAADKISLSRSSWHAIQDPTYRYNRVQLLEGIAKYFGEDPTFLMNEETEPSADYSSKLEAIQLAAISKSTQTYYRHAKRFPTDLLVKEVLGGLAEMIREDRNLTRDEILAIL